MKKIAIIGSGISGLVAAYTLQKKYDVTLFEANDYLGGHTATVDVELDKWYAIDTGFIVFNDKTYPNFKRFLAQLGVEWQDTEMGFSVSDNSFELEYSGRIVDILLTQKWNVLRPSFIRLIYEILKFNKLCLKLEAENNIPEEKSLGDFLAQHNFSEKFKKYYILPMVAAIWSSSYEEAEDFSLLFFIKFFSNHGLLTINDRPQWHVIKGGSREYVRALEKQKQFNVQLNTPVKSVIRASGGVEIETRLGLQRFDEVIFACHSDQALDLLADATADEKEVLSQIPYQMNQVTLHTDTKLLPKNPRAWACWNYMIKNDKNLEKYQSRVSYNMNILQSIESQHTFVVSLNQNENIDPSKILKKFEYAHPVFSGTAEQAKLQRARICGKHHTHFCGAYWYNGFHEDGVRSALDVVERLGASL